MSNKRRNSKSYTQNHGRPGVVYVLGNRTFPDLLKIGQTTDMARRLAQLNKDCNTSNPISRFFVLYQRQTADCGNAEQRAHDALKQHRLNDYREFFNTSLDLAKKAIDEACNHFDRIEEDRRRAIRAQDEAEQHRKQEEEEARRRIARMSEGRAKAAAEVAAERKLQEERRAAEEMEAVEAEEIRRRKLDDLRQYGEQQMRAAAPEFNPPPSPSGDSVFREASSSRGAAFSVTDPSPMDNVVSESVEGLAAIFRGLATIFFVVILFALATGNNEYAAPHTISPAQMEHRDRLALELARYSGGYTYPTEAAGDETILVAVTSSGRKLEFLYKSTSLGERIMRRDFNPDRIRTNMQSTACRKKEIVEFLAQGADVIYTLQRANGQKIGVQVACNEPSA